MSFNKFFLVIFLPIFISYGTHSYAQNNPYKIDDSLYPYMQKIQKNVSKKEVLNMCDTLFAMAGKINDVKAQCLAKTYRAEYYYYIRDFDNLIKEHTVSSAFAANTPYTQYVFGSWNRIISMYIYEQQYDKLLDELKKYKEEAYRLNNTYAIGQCLKHYGNVYTTSKQYQKALESYLECLDFYKKNGKNNELYNVYSSVASTYKYLKDYDKAKKYYDLSYRSAPQGTWKLRIAISTLKFYREYNNKDSMKKYLLLSEDLIRQYGCNAVQQDSYYECSAYYYARTHDFNKAIAYADSIKDPQNKNLRYANAYEYAGDYKNALIYFTRFTILKDSVIDAQNNEELAKATVKLNTERIQNEKNILELENTKMKVQQLQAQERLFNSEKEKNSLEIDNKNLDIQNKNLELQKQIAENKQQQAINRQKEEEARVSQMEYQASRTRNIYMTVVFSIIIIFFILYLINRNRNIRALRVEKNIALEAKKEAENANKIKTLFIQNMSHEIRTPLNVIVGFSNIICDDTIELEKEQKTQFTQLIHSNTNLLTTLINDILDLSKLESGTYKLDITDARIADICNNSILSVQSRVNEGVELITKIPPELKDLVIKTDIQRVQQVLTNFLTNACKYTDKGSITLSYTVENENVVFSVTDTGVGIPTEKAQDIFNRFEKLDSFKQGTGIGLNICQHIASLLKGYVKLDTSYTGGARFNFVLPLKDQE